jgi:hypothetical protein
MSTIVSTYLALLDSQREELFAQVETVPAEQLWARPARENWSPGEQLDHIRRFKDCVSSHTTMHTTTLLSAGFSIFETCALQSDGECYVVKRPDSTSS